MTRSKELKDVHRHPTSSKPKKVEIAIENDDGTTWRMVLRKHAARKLPDLVLGSKPSRQPWPFYGKEVKPR